MKHKSGFLLLALIVTLCQAEETTTFEPEEVTESVVRDAEATEFPVRVADSEKVDEALTVVESTTTKEEVKVCHHELNGPAGLFTTDNFPEDYKPSTNCSWNITVPEGQRVQLTFHLLNIEHNEQCVFDWVKVFDNNGTLLKQVCGFLSQDLVVLSTENKISIQFYSDGVIESKGFLASWQAVSNIPEDDNAPTVSGEKAKSYVLSFPQSFSVAPDAPPEKICLQLSNVDADGDVLVSLLSSKSIVDGVPLAELKIPHTAGNADVHCYNLSLPSNTNDSFAVVRVKADFPSINYKILSYKSVQALKSKPVVLIQTDKSDYRPKQEVKFRILLLSSQLKPNTADTIKSVWIEDPSDSRLAQWKDVSVKKGLVQLSMPLTEEPTLGTWKISADLESEGVVTATFTVSESVLPKFEVTIEGSSVILRDSLEETFKVCAKYTHGSNVKGNANVTFSSTHQDSSYWRAPPKVINVFKDRNELEQGCVEVKLNNTELGELSEKTSDISATVVVTEAATGEQQNSTWNGQVAFLPFKIDFVSSSTDHIIGGFPYVGSLKTIHHDGSPLGNVKINLCARLFSELESMRSYLTQSSHTFYSYDEDQIFALSEKLKDIRYTEKCFDLKTNDDGSLDFSVPLNADTIPKNVTTLSFHAIAVDHPANETSKMQQPFNKLKVSLTHSNLTSALTIHSIGQPKLKCDDNSIVAYFSAKPGEILELSYYITSGASIIGNGHQTINVGENDLTSEFLSGAQSLKFDGNVSTDGDKRVLSKQIITINRPLADETRVSNKIKLLVYIKDTKGRTLSATKEYEALSCNTSVSATWSAKQLTPASPVSLKLNGQPDALCGYSVVDKSVDLIANPNKVTQPKISELKEKLAESRIFASTAIQDSKCSNANLLYKAFEKMGLYLLSDALLENTACDSLIDVTHLGGSRQEVDDTISAPPVALSLAAAPAPDRFFPIPEPTVAEDFADEGFQAIEALSSFDYDVRQPSTTVSSAHKSQFAIFDKSGSSSIEKPTVELRNYFPETWLFDLIDLNKNGEASLDLETPHTITTWIADAVCADLQSGLSVSNKAELLVTQDFFADILLPYSVKRGEAFPLNVSVFNSVDQVLPMKVTLQHSEDYTSETYFTSLCLAAKDSNIKQFRVTAKELNEVNITVEAAISSGAEPKCGSPGEADGYKDTLQKSIQVKPEGYPVEKVQSEFLCRAVDQVDNEETIEMKSLKLPSDLVEGSARAWVSVTGDILAPALANLDGLVTLPTGCGEQNMITLVPNIYLLEYLKGTGKVETKLEDQARKYMKIGYERQNENYRHSDGSYSIWGPSKGSTPATDSQGSLWLTTFVVKAFGQASKFIDIDSRLLQKSIDWILNKQSRKSGCFEPVGQNIHSSLAGPEQSLTASVVVALLEVEASKLDLIIDPAFIETALRCIVENPAPTSDIYTRSLVTYALTLRHEMTEMLAQSGKSKKEFQRREAEELESTTSTQAGIEEQVDPCFPSPCGPYSKCRALKNVAICACLDGYVGSPPNCNPGCLNNADCPISLACIQKSCRNPCLGTCGTNADCEVINHNAHCKCEPGYTGDPFTSCIFLEPPKPILDTLNLSRDALADLLTHANRSLSGKIFWTTNDGSLSRAVEVTAYNTLSLIMQDNLPEALHAIKWMTTNRNSQGGFVSTQDTMVAMQALSKYSVRVSKEDNDLTLTAVSGAELHDFKLNEDNLLLVQKSKLEGLVPEGENEVSFKVKGKGCFMIQTVLRYNVLESPDKTSFTLTASQTDEELTLCASYIGDKKSTDMVVIEAELLSGFTPYELSLEALLNEIDDPVVKRYEIKEKENKIVLYFDNMSKKSTCWKIEVKRAIKIEELKPAIVKIYDYYNQEDVFSTEYNLPSTVAPPA